MRGSGRGTRTQDRAKELKFGQTGRCMKAGGLTAKPTGVADSSMLTETFTTVTGRMTRLTDMGATVTWTELSTKETGKKISNTDKD